jgi:dihydroorotase-like cyclic amidohydrolase
MKFDTIVKGGHVVTWSEVTGGQLYIVHMSTAQGTEIVKAAQAR